MIDLSLLCYGFEIATTITIARKHQEVNTKTLKTKPGAYALSSFSTISRTCIEGCLASLRGRLREREGEAGGHLEGVSKEETQVEEEEMLGFPEKILFPSILWLYTFLLLSRDQCEDTSSRVTRGGSWGVGSRASPRLAVTD